MGLVIICIAPCFLCLTNNVLRKFVVDEAFQPVFASAHADFTLGKDCCGDISFIAVHLEYLLV